MVNDGTEQVNDMFYESSLLQTGDCLRKTNEPLQEVIKQLTSKYTELVAEQAPVAWFGRGDSDTVDDVDHVILRYQSEEEEIEKSTDADEDTADHSGNESSDYEAQELEKYTFQCEAQLSYCDAELREYSKERRKAPRKAAHQSLYAAPSLESVWSQRQPSRRHSNTSIASVD
ncbi:hypothetical protein HPB50_029052 [Hyalomma asiaticum]|nr:hypothetical protein HPB50_029052 [Hyalomma asiaticum]